MNQSVFTQFDHYNDYIDPLPAYNIGELLGDFEQRLKFNPMSIDEHASEDEFRNDVPCNISLYSQIEGGEFKFDPKVMIGLGNLDPIGDVNSNIKFHINTSANRDLFTFLREKAEHEPMGEEDLDEYNSFSIPVWATAGSLHTQVKTNDTLKDDCRKIHAKHIHALVEYTKGNILVVGDALMRTKNFFANHDKKPFMVYSTTSVFTDHYQISLDNLETHIDNFSGYYLMYEAEVSKDDLSYIRDLFRDKVCVESYVDWHSMRNDKSPTVGVDPPYITPEGDYCFTACTGGKPFPSINYGNIEGYSKMDCFQFHETIGVTSKSKISHVRRLFHIWFRNLIGYMEDKFEFNTGLPLTDQDVSMIYSKQFKVAEKSDGRLGQLIIKDGAYKVTGFTSSDVIRSGDWFFPTDEARIQLEIMRSERHIITDVFCAKTGHDHFSGGFFFRYKYATMRRRYLSQIGIDVKAWYPPSAMEHVYASSKEGIVLQRNSPPGKILTKGERYGTARYIKKRWTIDLEFHNADKLREQYTGPGIYELEMSDYLRGIYKVVRKRFDKITPNTDFQQLLLHSVLTISDAMKTYPKLLKPCFLGEGLQSVVLSNVPMDRNPPKTLEEWQKKFRGWAIHKVQERKKQLKAVGYVVKTKPTTVGGS